MRILSFTVVALAIILSTNARAEGFYDHRTDGKGVWQVVCYPPVGSPKIHTNLRPEQIRSNKEGLTISDLKGNVVDYYNSAYPCSV